MRRISLLALFVLSGEASLHAQGAVATWTLTADRRIGSADGEVALTQVGSAAVDRAGRLYVGQPRESVVKVFDPSGRLLRTLGRRGQGPGEFQLVGAIGLRADSLWVSDGGLRRVSLFSPDGRFARSIPVPAWRDGTAGAPVRSAALLDDGSVVGRANVGIMRIANGEVTREPLLRSHGADEAMDTVAWLSTRNQVIYAQLAPGRVLTGPQMLGDAPLWRAAPSGSGLVVVEREAAEDGESATFSVTRYRADGSRLFRRDYRYRPLPVSPALIDSLVERHLQPPPGRSFPNRAAAERGIRRALYQPRHRPPVSEVLVGTDESIWLRREELERGRAAWQVLAPDGLVRAMVSVPRGVRLLAVSENFVWGTAEDELDVPYLVRYRIVRGASR